jgi:hypothetical protein
VSVLISTLRILNSLVAPLVPPLSLSNSLTFSFSCLSMNNMSCSCCVFIFFGRGADESVDVHHKMVLSALLKTETRSSRVECVDLLIFDVSNSDPNSNTCACMQDSAVRQLYSLPHAFVSRTLQISIHLSEF